MPVFFVLAGWTSLQALQRLPEAGSGARLLLYAYLPLLPAALVQMIFGGWWPFYPTLIKDWGALPKFAVILVPTMAITMAVYHVAVGPVPPLRFLFGLRPLRRRPKSKP